MHSKICAHIDREMDEEDIGELAQDKELFKKVSKQVLGKKRFKNEQARIIIQELEVRLGIFDED